MKAKPFYDGLFFIKTINGSELPMNNQDIIQKLTLGKEATETVNREDRPVARILRQFVVRVEIRAPPLPV